MPKTKLTYFDFSGSRGEECRLALFLADVPFEDERLTRAQWADRQASAPFGGLPILTVEGHPPLGQSNSILRLIGREHGLHPTDSWAKLAGTTQDDARDRYIALVDKLVAKYT